MVYPFIFSIDASSVGLTYYFRQKEMAKVKKWFEKWWTVAILAAIIIGDCTLSLIEDLKGTQLLAIGVSIIVFVFLQPKVVKCLGWKMGRFTTIVIIAYTVMLTVGIMADRVLPFIGLWENAQLVLLGLIVAAFIFSQPKVVEYLGWIMDGITLMCIMVCTALLTVGVMTNIMWY